MAFTASRFFTSFQANKSNAVLLTSPEEDVLLEVQFGYRSLLKRKENKRLLLQQLGVAKDMIKQPLLVIVSNFFQDVQELDHVLLGLKDLAIHVLVIAPRECGFTNKSANFSYQEWSEKIVHQALAGGDMVFLPSQCEADIGHACHRYGIVPLASTDLAGMRDYDPTMESGNAFLYKPHSLASIFVTLGRALETFKLSYDWQRIQKNGMEK